MVEVRRHFACLRVRCAHGFWFGIVESDIYIAQILRTRLLRPHRRYLRGTDAFSSLMMSIQPRENFDVKSRINSRYLLGALAALIVVAAWACGGDPETIVV